MTGSGAPVVLGLDASRRALTALVWAAEEARLRDVPLVLAHAVGPTRRATEDADTVLRRARHQLDRRQVHGPRGDRHGATPEVRTVCRRTDPVSLLADLSHRAALVAVGAPDAAGRDSLVDTVATRLAACSAAPLVVVRGDTSRSGDRPVVAALDRRPGRRPGRDRDGDRDDDRDDDGDGDGDSTGVLAAAVDVAVREHRPLVAVHAGDVDTGRRAALAAGLTEDVTRELTREGLPDNDVPLRVEVASDRPERALLERSDHAALIVLGIRRLRRSGPLDRLPVLAPLFARAAPLLGLSPLEEVLVWGSRCPVELVPVPA